MSFEFRLTRNRTTDISITLYESNGSTSITLAASDEVRFKMYRRDADTPDLDLDSAADSGNDSGIDIDNLGPSPAASVTVRFAQADLTGLNPGVYKAEVTVVDDSETAPVNAIKHVESGVIYLQEAPGGDIDLT